MVSRSQCLYGDEIIGIESVYTLVDGKQINKENEVERIRELGRKNQLFCPCGCGANLILVAGEKNLRRQHFRSHADGNDELEKSCTWKEESELSIQSKIALKCWLESKMDMKDSGLKYSVRATDISKKGKKFELSLYSQANDFAIVYAKDKRGIYDEKLNYLKEFLDTKILYVTSIENHVANGQYPEFMKKIQNKQGFCAFLMFENSEKEYKYENAYLRTVFYRKNMRGLWVCHDLTSAKLDEYDFNKNNELSLNGESVFSMLTQRLEHLNEMEAAMLAERKAEEERRKKEQEETERKREKQARELEIKRRKEIMKQLEEAQRREEEQNMLEATVLAEKEQQEKFLEAKSNMVYVDFLQLRGITEKTKAVKYLLEKHGKILTGQFTQHLNGRIVISKKVIDIAYIIVEPSVLRIFDRYNNSYLIFIGEEPTDEAFYELRGYDVPYCHLSLRYTSMKDIERVMKQKFGWVEEKEKFYAVNY